MRKIKSIRLDANGPAFIVYATLASFLTYTAMYAVRKAFAAGTYEGTAWLGIDGKTWLITAQIIGYTLSKYIGIRVVAEITPLRRARAILLLVSASVLALLLFALLPFPWSIACLFLNGLPIGMIFGLVFNYLEGRRSTEILVTGLTITQIFSSGFVKTTGRFLTDHFGVSDPWMPFLTGLLFYPVLLAGVWMLERLPAPSAEDIALKSARRTMDRNSRRRFVRRFFFGLFLFMISYVLMTAYRDYRDNFAVEIWNALGIHDNAGLITMTEIPTALIILLTMIGLQSISDNAVAFRFLHWLSIAGGLLALGATLLYARQSLSPVAWISMTGIGLYLAYVPANTIFFERMIALFRYPGNASFVVTMADFFGYCGSLGILLYKNFGGRQLSHSDFFLRASVLVPLLLILLQTASLLYFFRKNRKETVVSEAAAIH